VFTETGAKCIKQEEKVGAEKSSYWMASNIGYPEKTYSLFTPAFFDMLSRNGKTIFIFSSSV